MNKLLTLSLGVCGAAVSSSRVAIWDSQKPSQVSYWIKHEVNESLCQCVTRRDNQIAIIILFSASSFCRSVFLSFAPAVDNTNVFITCRWIQIRYLKMCKFVKIPIGCDSGWVDVLQHAIVGSSKMNMLIPYHLIIFGRRCHWAFARFGSSHPIAFSVSVSIK